MSPNTKKAILLILFNTIFLSVLAWFRFAIYDEKLFLHETVLMSEILKQGEWIGNYGVGVHGFLFKLPVALVFLFSGPSIYIATLFHVLLSSATAWIFYLLLEKNFARKWLPLLCLFLLIINFSYVSWSTTFHREIPVIFALLFFVYVYTSKNKYRMLFSSLLLMLILDAKEYVFFMVLPPLGIHLLLLEYIKNRKIWISIWNSFKKFLLFIIPALIYLYLMFFTNLFPINMFNASFLGLTESSFSYQMRHTTPETALSDLSSYTNNNALYHRYLEGSEDGDFCIFGQIILFLAYFEKFFYISNFSFQSIPLAILIPSLVSSVYAFRIWFKEKKNLLFINLLYWIYLLIYIIRTSHQRYLFPIIPFSTLFFILFFVFHRRDKKGFNKYFKVTLWLMSFATLATMFYQDFTSPRELFNIFITAFITFLFFMLYYWDRYRDHIIKLIVVTIVIASLFITSYALSTKNQVYNSLLWGINGETDKIASFLEPEDRVFANIANENQFMYLINIYRANNYLPIEWKWRIDRSKVTRDLDAIEIEENLFYGIEMEDMEEFRHEIYENQINKILFVQSQVEEVVFPLEEHIDSLQEQTWLKLERVEQMHNKKLFILEVL